MEEQNNKKSPLGAPKPFNPDDPYGVNEILEEKDRQYHIASNKKKAPSAVRWLVIFAPVYLLAAMPFAIWLKNVHEKPDVQLSGEQQNAFVADDKIDYSVVDTTPVVAASTKTVEAITGPDPLQELFKTDIPGAVNSVFEQRTPQQVRDFFNSEAVSEHLAQKLKEGGAWDTPEGLLKYLAENEEGKKLLAAFAAQREKAEVVNAGLSSGSFMLCVAAPAVISMATEPAKYAPLVAQNAQLLSLLSAEPVGKALSGLPNLAAFVKAVTAPPAATKEKPHARKGRASR